MIASVSEELVDIEEQLNIQQESLNQIKEQTSYQEALIADILNACDIYKNAGTQQKKAVLQLLISRIEVSDVNEADIYLNI